MKDPSLACGRMCQVISTYTSSVCIDRFLSRTAPLTFPLFYGGVLPYGTIVFLAKKRALPCTFYMKHHNNDLS